jgi:hypothetical protein
MRFDRPLLHCGLLALLLAFATADSAATVIVPDDAPTISAALQAIASCDTVLVRSGTYVEEVGPTFPGFPICFTLRSESGPESTEIVGGIWAPHEEAAYRITIDGFTIRDGIGIRISSASPGCQIAIRHCVIENNSKLGRPGLSPNGGGINLSTYGNLFPSNNPLIKVEDCIIRGNEGAAGGGLYIRHETKIANCVITDNLATGAGGGIYCDATNGRRFIQTSTIAGNQSTGGGAGIHWLGNIPGPKLRVQNVIVALNEGGYGIFANGITDSVGITCSNAWENSAGNYFGFPDPTGTAGNLSVDPLFCAPEDGNYQLQIDSPCANAPGCGLIGGLGTGCEVAGVGEAAPGLASLRLSPNPSPASITIELGSGAGDHAALLIYDVLGRQVARLLPQELRPTRATWTWPLPGAERPPAGSYYFTVDDRGSRVAMGRGVLLAP